MARDPEKVRASKNRWKLRNKERIRISGALYRANNLEKQAAHAARFKRNNPTYFLDWARCNTASRQASNRKYREQHPAAIRASTARRKAVKLEATPIWANEFFIEEIYDLAQRRTKATGQEWHIDHIVPLKHPLVCGLHVEYNLQVILAKDNLCKSNTFVI